MLRTGDRMALLALATAALGGCANNDHLAEAAPPRSTGSDPASTTADAGGSGEGDVDAGDTPAAPGGGPADDAAAPPEEPAYTPRPIWTCRAEQSDGSLFGKTEVCADFPEALGWTEATARQACEDINRDHTFEEVADCDQACVRVAEDPSQRCQDASDNGPVSFRYDQPSCRGAFYNIGEIFGAPADDPDQGGPFTCYNEGCGLAPADDDVLTCRYASDFVDQNCADFPASEGWTEADVRAHCEAQQGAKPETVVVTTGDSCLVELGGTGGAARCMTSTGGKAWAAYGAPQAICEGFIGDEGARVHQEGPFCQPYQ